MLIWNPFSRTQNGQMLGEHTHLNWHQMAKGPTASLMKWKDFLSLPESIQKQSLQTIRAGKLMRDYLTNGKWTFNVVEQSPNEEV
mgnify:CR=1 FL=1